MAQDANAAEFKRWFTQAEHDLRAAQSSSSSGHFEWACFQAQQSAEKALKAFVFLHGERGVLGHSVWNLIRKCEEIDASFSSVHAARELDQYYIPTRYPNGLPEQVPHEFYNSEDARTCIAQAGSVLRLVRERAKPSTR